MKNVILVGAHSAIAKAYLYSNGNILGRVALCARNSGALNALEMDVRARYPTAEIQTWIHDAKSPNDVESVWTEMMDFVGVAEEVVIAAGALGTQSDMARDPKAAYELVVLNSASATYWALLAAQALKRQQRGCLGIITSVAGVRGRASNYIYGSTKAQLICLAEGLRCELAAYGVRVVDFRPGLVDTPMTAHLKKGLLAASSSLVGAELAHAMESGDGVVYSPGFWRGIMFVIRHIPYAVFKKIRF